MQDTLDQIPPEAWPLIDFLFNATLVVGVIWLALTTFVLWRRSASNLTPVNAARRNKKAQPDFLNVDDKARETAMERGETFDKELEAQARARSGSKDPISLTERIASFVSLFMSLFSLATMVFGAIFQVSRMGSMMEEYSSIERIKAVLEAHPIAFIIASLVIVFHIYRYFTQRKWQEG